MNVDSRLKASGQSLSECGSDLAELLEYIANATYSEGASTKTSNAVDVFRHLLYNCGIVSNLLQLLCSVPIFGKDDRRLLEAAIRSLTNIAFNEQVQTKVAEDGTPAVAVLVERLRLDIDCAEVQLKIARCITTLCFHGVRARSQFIENNGIAIALVSIVRNFTHEFACEKLIKMLAALRSAEEFQEAVFALRGQRVFLDLQALEHTRMTGKQKLLLRSLQDTLCMSDGGREGSVLFPKRYESTTNWAAGPALSWRDGLPSAAGPSAGFPGTATFSNTAGYSRGPFGGGGSSSSLSGPPLPLGPYRL